VPLKLLADFKKSQIFFAQNQRKQRYPYLKRATGLPRARASTRFMGFDQKAQGM